MNLSKTAGSNKGYKLTDNFRLNRTGKLNPMYGKIYSKEFLDWQIKNKFGINNPNYGNKKTDTTIDKLTKLIYVYNQADLSFIGEYTTVKCSKKFNMGKDILTKKIKKGLPFKGKIFSHKKLH
jgi:NUMOD3 motif